MRRGQATTEWMVLLSVLAIGILVAAYAFYPSYRSGLDALGGDASRTLSAGTQNGTGNMR